MAMLPPVLFETFPNAHNGYGGSWTWRARPSTDAGDFFDRYYAPGNAVLSVVGDFDPDEAFALVERALRRHAAGPGRPGRTSTSRRRRASGGQTQADPLAPVPAVAAGWRVPDPADLAAYLPFVVLTPSLADGDASRLGRRLVQDDRAVTQLGGYLGLMERPVRRAGPHRVVFQAHHSADLDRRPGRRGRRRGVRPAGGRRAGPGRAGAGPGPARPGVVQASDPVLARTLSMASVELQRGRAELLWELPGRLADGERGQVQAAAATLAPGQPGRARVGPGGAR